MSMVLVCTKEGCFNARSIGRSLCASCQAEVDQAEAKPMSACNTCLMQFPLGMSHQCPGPDPGAQVEGPRDTAHWAHVRPSGQEFSLEPLTTEDVTAGALGLLARSMERIATMLEVSQEREELRREESKGRREEFRARSKARRAEIEADGCPIFDACIFFEGHSPFPCRDRSGAEIK